MTAALAALIFFAASLLILFAAVFAISAALIAARALARRLTGPPPPARQLTTTPQPSAATHTPDGILLARITDPTRPVEARADDMRILLIQAPRHLPALVDLAVAARLDALYVPLIERFPLSLRAHLDDDAMTRLLLEHSRLATPQLRAALSSLAADKTPRWSTIAAWTDDAIARSPHAPNLPLGIALSLQDAGDASRALVVDALRAHPAPHLLAGLRPYAPALFDALTPPDALLTLLLSEAAGDPAEQGRLLRDRLRDGWDPALEPAIMAALTAYPALLIPAASLARAAPAPLRAALLLRIASQPTMSAAPLSAALDLLRDADTDAALTAAPLAPALLLAHLIPALLPHAQALCADAAPAALGAALLEALGKEPAQDAPPALLAIIVDRIAPDLEALGALARGLRRHPRWRLALLDAAPPPLPADTAAALLDDLMERPHRWPAGLDPTQLINHALSLPPGARARTSAFAIIPQHGTRGCAPALQQIIARGSTGELDAASARAALTGLFKRIGAGERGTLELVDGADAPGALTLTDTPQRGAITIADPDDDAPG